MTQKLTIELVPETAWYTNVRSNVSVQEWDRIRKKCYSLAGYKCEICGATGIEQGYKYPVECHETWEYNDETHVQKLVGLIALCPHCHKVKHPGLANMRGEGKIVLDQIMKVNSMSREQASTLVNDAFVIWGERSRHKWTLDIEFLKSY